MVWYRTVLPLEKSDVETIKTMEHVNKVYPYYLFMSKHRNAMNVYRNGEVVEMNKEATDEWNSSIPDYFAAVPIYEEEMEGFNEGIYVCDMTAKKYNLLPGDDVELFLEIPIAISKCVKKIYDKEMDAYIGGNSYLTTLVTFKTKVIGLMESNSHQPEIYMRYEDMEALHQEQMKRYHDGEIQAEVDNTYSTNIKIDYDPSAIAVFVDRYENILNVMNKVEDESGDIFVYSEYLAMQDIIEETKSLYKDAMRIGVISSAFFVIGALVIFVIYISRNKSTYMMLRLSGKSSHFINTLMLIHTGKLIFSMLAMCIPIYISASLPDIIEAFNFATWDHLWANMNELYLTYYVYFKYSSLHFITLFVSLIIVVCGGYSMTIYRYKKLDLIKWIRGD